MSTSSDAARDSTVWVTAEPLTSGAFAPFGDVLGPAGDRRPISVYGESIDLYRAGVIDADVPVEFLMSRSGVREFRVRFLERHVLLAQSFFALAGGGFIAVVAAPDAPLCDGVPAAEAIRAFLVDPGVGITLHRGTWHEPPFPLAGGQIRLTTSHAELSTGLESGLDERGEIAQGDVDKRDVTQRTGRTVRIALP